ncbi:MAG: hypothetical protein CM15mP126_4600 [Gammaproteobacteria bacterium]|nr:MAG: hypothetical protein CM15mP126_4600 [Gammaproteobacteria bacterium]
MFLLHQRSYGETSLIIDVFTKKDGKISLIAKGAKNQNLNFWLPCSISQVKFNYSGRSELKTLTNIDRNLMIQKHFY